MLYSFFCYVSNLFSFLFNACALFSVLIPYFTLLCFVACICSKFVRLRRPDLKMISQHIGNIEADDNKYNCWPIMKQGGNFDAPENSAAALKNVREFEWTDLVILLISYLY